MALDVRPITPDVARQLNLRGAEGVLVFGVEDESPAAEAGLQRGQQSHYVAFTIAKG
jgi:S1-C subfamily serine protease